MHFGFCGAVASFHVKVKTEHIRIVRSIGDMRMACGEMRFPQFNVFDALGIPLTVPLQLHTTHYIHMQFAHRILPFRKEKKKMHPNDECICV